MGASGTYAAISQAAASTLRLVSSDETNDLALLQAAKTFTDVAKIRATAVRSGDQVVAIGHRSGIWCGPPRIKAIQGPIKSFADNDQPGPEGGNQQRKTLTPCTSGTGAVQGAAF